VKEDVVRISAGEPTPLQRAAWHRLWAILLTPVESQRANTGNECAVKPETATPHRRQRKQCDADKPTGPENRNGSGATPSRQTVRGNGPGGFE
jgi:hypothetical protein